MSDSNFVFNIIFWIRVAFGVISGFSAGLLGFTSDNPDANMGIFFGISMYLLSTAIVRQIFLSKIKEIEEFNIGHFIIGESISDGLKNVIKKINKFIKK